MAAAKIDVSLRFINAQHRRFHLLLTGYGFGFEVGANLRVGTRYTNLEKGFMVELVEDDGSFEPTVRSFTKGDPYKEQLPSALMQDDYTPEQWETIQNAGPDPFVMLDAELSVWLPPAAKKQKPQEAMG